MKHLELDLTSLMAGVLPEGGISKGEWEGLQGVASSAFEESMKRRTSGEIGFWDVVDGDAAAACVSFRERLPPSIENVVVLGIGGSSLGPHALDTALADGTGRRMFFPDNPDPQSFYPLLESLPVEATLFNVVTKSGGTAETAAQLLIVADRIEKAVGREGLRRHLVATTDPTSGALRRESEALGLSTLPIPSNIGGRFSVLTAVGLLPAALANIDVEGLVAGARAMRDRCVASSSLAENPALALAAALFAHDQRKGRPMVVMMPYSDRLYDCAEWFRQLWAESLGKVPRSGGPGIGPTPIASRGATDQHSQLQLYAEGPDDKSYLFLTLRDRGAEPPIPRSAFGHAKEFSYLSERRIGELLDAELRGTRASLVASGRPNGTITLDSLSAQSVGAFLMLLEAATAFAGPMYGVDAFDQPGVEQAKRLAYAALGREGYSENELLGRGDAKDPAFCF